MRFCNRLSHIYENENSWGICFMLGSNSTSKYVADNYIDKKRNLNSYVFFSLSVFVTLIRFLSFTRSCLQ